MICCDFYARIAVCICVETLWLQSDGESESIVVILRWADSAFCVLSFFSRFMSILTLFPTFFAFEQNASGLLDSGLPRLLRWRGCIQLFKHSRIFL